MARATTAERPPQQLTVTRERGSDARRLLGKLPIYALLIAVALWFLLPLLWLVSTAFKSDIYNDTGWIPQNPTLENFNRILGASSDVPVFRWLTNSVLVSGIGTALTVLLTSLSAYAFARIDFRGRNLLFSLMITTLLLPGVMFLVPQFLLIVAFTDMGPPLSSIAGLNTYGALILPGLAGVFGMFFMRQFFFGIPIEIEEAAYVDGANRFRTFLSIVLPLAGPALATLAVITFLAYWNDYLWPLIVCEGAGCTLTPGLRNFQGQYTVEYDILMAGALIAAVPVLIVYVVAQRWIVQAVTSSGVKG